MTAPTAKEIGYLGEKAVCRFLEKHEYEIVKRNFTIRGGEIDIIASKGEMLAFVEVKTRHSGAMTSGEEAITAAKKKSLIRTAEEYIRKFGCENMKFRFDVAVVSCDDRKLTGIRYYTNAFDASK